MCFAKNAAQKTNIFAIFASAWNLVQIIEPHVLWKIWCPPRCFFFSINFSNMQFSTVLLYLFFFLFLRVYFYNRNTRKRNMEVLLQFNKISWYIFLSMVSDPKRYYLLFFRKSQCQIQSVLFIKFKTF